MSASVAAGVLTVTGDAADDAIVISCLAGNADVVGVAITPAPVACNAVSVINVVSGAGADSIDLQGVAASAFTILTNPVTINAGEGNDTVIGSGIDDQISGDGGDDLMLAVPSAGDDTLLGGAGADVARASGLAADEEVFSLRPSELVVGGGSVDLIGAETTRMHFGAVEALELQPGAGNDTVLSGDLSAATELASVKLDGGAGDDLLDLDGLVGPTGTAHGGPGSDTLTGSAGPDTLVGGPGGDFVTGGGGADLTTWAVGDGDDTLLGGAGNDSHTVTGDAQGESFTLELRQSDSGAESIRMSRGGSRIGDLLQFEGLAVDTGAGADGVLVRESFSSFSFGTIAISGSSEPDSVTVRGTQESDRHVLRSDGGKTIVERMDAASYDLEISETEVLNVRGRGGDDVVDAADLAADIAIELFGGGGGDTLIGGAGSDKLKGGRGNDNLRGRRGSDRLWGGRGRDKLLGGAGADVMLGASGADIVKGGGGDDRAVGGRGPDDIGGGRGNDVIDGGGGDDLLFGVAGDDRLLGRSGDDTLTGGAGSDSLDGGLGIDTARGVDEAPGPVDRLRRIDLIEQ